MQTDSDSLRGVGGTRIYLLQAKKGAHRKVAHRAFPLWSEGVKLFVSNADDDSSQLGDKLFL